MFFEQSTKYKWCQYFRLYTSIVILLFSVVEGQGQTDDFFIEDKTVTVRGSGTTSLQVTFRVDGVALEPDETFQLRLTITPGTPELPADVFFVDTLMQLFRIQTVRSNQWIIVSVVTWVLMVINRCHHQIFTVRLQCFWGKQRNCSHSADWGKTCHTCDSESYPIKLWWLSCTWGTSARRLPWCTCIWGETSK